MDVLPAGLRTRLGYYFLITAFPCLRRDRRRGRRIPTLKIPKLPF